MSVLLFNPLLDAAYFDEHHRPENGGGVSFPELGESRKIYFMDDSRRPCAKFSPALTQCKVETSYFVGVDWIGDTGRAISVRPKRDGADGQLDYLKMLMTALKRPDVSSKTGRLYEIKLTATHIEVPQQDDLLTPLLVLQFLAVMREIARKGLKKSFYQVTHNLQSRIKGKVLVGRTVKENVLKLKPLHTVCRYEEFGVNSVENRLLKKALLFVERYLLQSMGGGQADQVRKFLRQSLHFVHPVFEPVEGDVQLREVSELRVNPFFQEYAEALRLAKLILQRWGYNLNAVHGKERVKVPPFWIDMSLMFELYVLGLLKDVYKEKVVYHPRTHGNELDFLLKDGRTVAEMDQMPRPIVIDAKYKYWWKVVKGHDDVRQVSGYARLRKVHELLDWPPDRLLDCLIVYPDPSGNGDLSGLMAKKQTVEGYLGVYKIGVKLPVMGANRQKGIAHSGA